MLVDKQENYWRNRRVFLTGHTGFKGSWLTMTLSLLGAEVYGYALEPLDGAIYQQAGIARLLANSTIADIRDYSALRRAIEDCQPEVVFHLAAQPLVRLSYEIPIETFAVNVLGTVHVLEALRGQEQLQAAVMVTSDKCYENREWIWGYREDEPMGGYDPYSCSKGCSELAISSYRRSFFTGERKAPIASARAGNVIGGGDVSRDRLLPDLVDAFRADLVAEVRSPTSVRPWQHVMEPLTGYMALAEALVGDRGADLAGGWNFGPESTAERTVRDVVDTAARAWGGKAAWHHVQGVISHEAHFLKLDSSKANRLLKWRSRWSFERSIQATIDWYKAQSAGADMSVFTKAQIETYLDTPQIH